MSGGVGFWSDTHQLFEDAMEMKAAHARGSGEGVKAGHVIGGFDSAASRGDRRNILFAQCDVVRSATLAGTESGLFGGFAIGVEPDVLAAGTARGAGRTAINAGCFNGVKEMAVGIGVAANYGIPTLIIVAVGGAR